MTDNKVRDEDDLNRELIELLNELRVALPGVQVLFAFLLAVPFANGWTRVTDLQRDIFFVAFLAASRAAAFAACFSAREGLWAFAALGSLGSFVALGFALASGWCVVTRFSAALTLGSCARA